MLFRSPHADPFSTAVTGYLAGRDGTVAAAIYDVSTGQTWTLGSGSPQATGSLVKVDILQALLARRPSGLPAADRARARSMIENNDNAPATTLWNQAGRAAGLRSYNASVGLVQTTPSACLVCAGFAWPGWAGGGPTRPPGTCSSTTRRARSGRFSGIDP